MYKFNNIITHAPTACLIEDYQTLQRALDAIDICPHDTQEHIRCVMECLASVIDSCTKVPTGLDIKPSPSSLIAMSCQEGILTDEKGKDFLCAAGKPVSGAMSGGCCQCDETCAYFGKECDPENCHVLLPDEFMYEPGPGEDEKLLNHLGEEAEDDKPEAMRLPTCEEYDLLVTAVKEDNSIMHWEKISSWCQDVDQDRASYRAIRGYHSARVWDNYYATNRSAVAGFRPVIEILNPKPLVPDGVIITVGTLYMDGKPVKVPQNPTQDGDIPNYIHGAKLEMREALDDPSYQVQAIKIGNVLIADRVLLKKISWDDTQNALSSLALGKMRLPTCGEYNLLATATKEDNSLLHWKKMYSWCQDVDPDRAPHRVIWGNHSAHYWSNNPVKFRHTGVGFRPAFEILNPDSLTPDGTIITVGTLYMDGKPVKVPQNPTQNGDVSDYIPGAKLEMREALDDPSYQVKAIKADDVLVADRVLLKNISWNDTQDALRPEQTETQDTQKALNPGKMRLPTCEEYDFLATAVKEDNDTMHWAGIFSLCQDANPDWTLTRAVRGYRSARHWSSSYAAHRNVSAGFRPAIENLTPGPLPPDGTIITVGTFYMNGQPVKVPQNPTRDGDIPDYIPGAKLEMREALDDPSYQVQAIKAGDVLIVDRVLLKNISWDDLNDKILEGESTMKTNTSVICLDDEVFGACAIACSQANEDKVRSFFVKRYPVWAAKCKGKVGMTPWNNIVDALRDMKELLDDENLRFLGGCAITRFPNQG